jgi:hypothetical protein
MVCVVEAGPWHSLDAPDFPIGPMPLMSNETSPEIGGVESSRRNY